MNIEQKNYEQAIPKIEWFKNMAIKMNLGDRALESLDVAISALRAQAELALEYAKSPEEIKQILQQYTVSNKYVEVK